jgi:uncharacterized membrane protein
VAFGLMSGLDLLPVAVYAEFAGLASLLLGIQVLALWLTDNPILSGIAFLWMAVVGLLALPLLRLRGVAAFRIFGAVGLVIAAILWGVSGYVAYWGQIRPAMEYRAASVQQGLGPQQSGTQQMGMPSSGTQPMGMPSSGTQTK